LKTALAEVRHAVLDMDGTLYLGGNLFPQTLPFLAALRRLNIGYSFLTNNCSHSRADYARRLDSLGIAAAPGSILTSAHATISHLKHHLPAVKKLFVLGTPSLVGEFCEAGLDVVDSNPDAVVVGFDTAVTYERLAQTAYWISRGLPYVATHPDRVCPTDREIVLPDCGAICALLESATGRTPDAVPGKPHPAMLQPIFEKHGLAAEQVMVVGDRLYTDIRMARDAGAVGVLTLTGETKLAQVESCPAAERPLVVIRNLEELTRLLEEARDAR
jgi:HAD superfamily hydrolase (TIGR01450 family)